MISCASALLLAFYAAQAQAQTPLFDTYVAFGDSFVSGVGATGVPKLAKGQECGLSPIAWPHGVRSRLMIPKIVFAACSGANTQDVIASQMSLMPPADQLNNALITITIGGNDLRLDERVSKCFSGSLANPPQEGACGDLEQLLNNIDAAINDSLASRLYNAYQLLRAAAPNATILAVGYPHLVDAVNETCDQTWTGWVINRANREKMNYLADAINAQIEKAATAAGIYYLTTPVVDYFRGHEACSGVDEWIVSADAALQTGNFGIGHPNDNGYPAYADVVAAAFY